MRHELKTIDRIAYLIVMLNPAEVGIKSPGPLYYTVQGYGEKSCPCVFWSCSAKDGLQFGVRQQADNFVQMLEVCGDADWIGGRLVPAGPTMKRLRDYVEVQEHIFEELA